MASWLNERRFLLPIFINRIPFPEEWRAEAFTAAYPAPWLLNETIKKRLVFGAGVWRGHEILEE